MRTNIQLKFLGQNSKFPFINYFFQNDVGSFFWVDIYQDTHNVTELCSRSTLYFKIFLNFISKIVLLFQSLLSKTLLLAVRKTFWVSLSFRSEILLLWACLQMHTLYKDQRICVSLEAIHNSFYLEHNFVNLIHIKLNGRFKE